ncbi:hypothetical protein ACIRO3_34325 [Streptomyces sp. NPDC102278]|uniref:hypothetical protein n=1 Tax=Streptomyces sp. NPDC102278 TaxID=3366152 RepID=UPI0037FC686E
MSSDDLTGKTRDLMYVEYPTDTRLSQSSTSGGRSALVRDEDNALVTHAVLYPAGGDAISVEDVVKVVKVVAAVGVTAGIVLGVAATKAAPHVRNGLAGLRSKLSRKSQGDVEAAAHEASSEQSDPAIQKRQPPAPVTSEGSRRP